MSAFPPATYGTIMRTGLLGYASAASTGIPHTAPAAAMQTMAISFIAMFLFCRLSRRHAYAESRILVGSARLAATPAQRPRITAEQPGSLDLRLVDPGGPVGTRCDIERIGRTVDLT